MTNEQQRPVFSLDLETVGLYGPAFSAGWVTMTPAGDVLPEHSGYAYEIPPPQWFDDYGEHGAWVREHVMPHLLKQPEGVTAERAPAGLLVSGMWLAETVWNAWLRARTQTGCLLLGDCPYPVETTFLRRCVKQCLTPQAWMHTGLYPVLDLESAKRAVGWTLPDERGEDEPAHHAYFDALVTARAWWRLRRAQITAVQSIERELDRHARDLGEMESPGGRESQQEILKKRGMVWGIRVALMAAKHGVDERGETLSPEAHRTRRALNAITEERTKQVKKHGWDAAHDDQYAKGQLADAAACMALAPGAPPPVEGPYWWPWPWDNGHWDKHLDRPRMRQLAVAGSLIVAEMERLMRAEGGTP